MRDEMSYSMLFLFITFYLNLQALRLYDRELFNLQHDQKYAEPPNSVDNLRFQAEEPHFEGDSND
jgi:hypothetical protein